MHLHKSICINAKYAIKDSLKKSKLEVITRKHINKAKRMSKSLECSRKKEEKNLRFIKAKINFFNDEILELRLFYE